MDFETIIIVSLLVFILLREIWNAYVMHRMVSKIMSRNYSDFQYAEKVGRIKNEVAPQKVYDPDDAEDLGALTGIL